MIFISPDLTHCSSYKTPKELNIFPWSQPPQISFKPKTLFHCCRDATSKTAEIHVKWSHNTSQCISNFLYLTISIFSYSCPPFYLQVTDCFFPYSIKIICIKRHYDTSYNAKEIRFWFSSNHKVTQCIWVASASQCLWQGVYVPCVLAYKPKSHQFLARLGQPNCLDAFFLDQTGKKILCPSF